METPAAIWGVLDAAMLVLGPGNCVIAVVKGYRGELPESTKHSVSEEDRCDLSLTGLERQIVDGFGACSGLADEFQQSIDLY
jgi:hypothetical protein